MQELVLGVGKRIEESSVQGVLWVPHYIERQ